MCALAHAHAPGMCGHDSNPSAPPKRRPPILGGHLFGYDTDGDLIIDEGIAYKLDKQITAYTQTGGIIALKTSTLDSKIKSSQTRITKLEDQMEQKEAELKQKYSSMQGSLSNLENQQTTISNFTKQQNKDSN